jgi:predicted nucleic acid-binding protein
MKLVFADTAYWIALLNPWDQFHERALEASTRLSELRIVTSEWVLIELLNAFASGGPEMRAAAASAIAE